MQHGRANVQSTKHFPTQTRHRFVPDELRFIRRKREQLQSLSLAGVQNSKMQTRSRIEKQIQLLLPPHTHLFPLKLTFDFLFQCKTSIIFTPALGSLQTKTFKAVKSWAKVKWYGGSISWCFFPAQQGTPANLLHFVQRLSSNWIFPLAL